MEHNPYAFKQCTKNIYKQPFTTARYRRGLILITSTFNTEIYISTKKPNLTQHATLLIDAVYSMHLFNKITVYD